MHGESAKAHRSSYAGGGVASSTDTEARIGAESAGVAMMRRLLLALLRAAARVPTRAATRPMGALCAPWRLPHWPTQKATLKELTVAWTRFGQRTRPPPRGIGERDLRTRTVRTGRQRSLLAVSRHATTAKGLSPASQARSAARGGARAHHARTGGSIAIVYDLITNNFTRTRRSRPNSPSSTTPRPASRRRRMACTCRTA